jgi:SpoVK/Ycf46/Vps4 family AAA+-type ATPase
MLPIVQLLGADEPSKRLIAAYTAARLGLHLYRLPAAFLPPQTGDQETLIRLWQRETALLPLALYLDAQEQSAQEGQQAINRFLSRCEGAIFLATREPWPHLDRTNVALDAAKPTPDEQRDTWIATLRGRTKELRELGDLADQLSAQFNLDLATIRQIAQAELAEKSEEQPLPERLWKASRASVRPRLEALAQRLEMKSTWDDIVLQDEEMQALHQIAGQVSQRTKVYQTWGFANKMNRGFGISALFAGESGTGKTMAAEVIANELRLDLYRIDLSQVVNKYIGETEKNLRRVFDAAEDGGAILLFDEADALFGKRSEVKDSHDRYANIEINYLLQRIESYRGLAILATNMKGALDTAFMRRLRFIVNFSVPAAPQRKAIWQKVFPPETRTEGLDYDRLARLNLTGGLIHNVALNAAFLAAQTGTAVTLPLVLTAARAEFRKLDRPINEGDFRWLETAGAGTGG